MRPFPCVFLLLCACKPDPSEEACREAATQEAALELGGGFSEWEPIGATMTVEAGPQGGWHVFGSLRATGLWQGTSDGLADETTPLVSFTLAADDDSFTGGYQDLPRVLRVEGDHTVLIGELVVLMVNDPTLVDDVPVTLQATVTDACGTTVSDDAATTLAWGG